MKFIIKNIFSLLVFAIAFSGLTACNKIANSAKQSENSNSAANETVKKGDNQISETSKPKSEFPPFPSALMKAEIKKTDDSVIKLEDKKGSVILLNLWATWCGPCRGEMPHLVEMQDKFRDKKFEIIGLDVDPESVEDINKFSEQMKLNYQLGFADDEMMKEFLNISKFSGIPQSFLIDRDGRLRGVFVGGGPKVINTMKETVEKIASE